MKPLQKSALTDTEWIDVQLLNELKQDIGEDVLHEIIQVYLTELTEHVKQMQQACHQKDWIALGELAHCIKSSSGSLGAQRLFHTALNIEMLCRKGMGSQCVPEFNHFMNFTAPTQDALRAYLANAP